MSDILGFDIDGRPLRAGDKVVMINAVNPRSMIKNGAVITVMCDAGWIESGATGRVFQAFNPEEAPGFYAEYAAVRKLNDDHLPAPQTYEQLIQNLKTGETA